MTQEVPKARLKDQIDLNLRRVYDEVLQEEVPDRFKLLLEELRMADKQRTSKK